MMFGPERRQGVSRFGVALWAVLGATAWCNGTYAQQLRIPNTVYKSYGGIPPVGQIANTSVSQNFQGLSNPGTASWSKPQGTYMAREAQESLFGSRARRHRPGLDLVAQSPAAMRAARLPTRWRSNLSPSGAARYFAAPPRYGQAAARRGGARAGGVLDLLNPHKLLSSTAFAAPALRMSTGTVGIRDPFSSRDNTSAARHSGDARPLERTGEQHTQAELMESRLAAMRERAMGEAWAWFEKGEYRRARASFENAEMLDRTHPEPRAGILFCCLAQRAYTQTIYSMGRILFWDGSRGNILGTDLNLLDRYAPPLKDRPDLREAEAVARLKRDVADFLAFAGHHRAKLSVQATVAYVLWHAGGRQEASRIARGMREYDPGGQFGQFADSILAAAGEEAEAGRGG